jgi:hypothetical protein
MRERERERVMMESEASQNLMFDSSLQNQNVNRVLETLYLEENAVLEMKKLKYN